MPRYIVNVVLNLRPAQEDEDPVIIEISDERAASLLEQDAISLIPATEEQQVPATPDVTDDDSATLIAAKKKSPARRSGKKD